MQNKLNRRKSDSVIKTSKKLIKGNKPSKSKIKPFHKNAVNQTTVKYEEKAIQSLKQNLKKRVMEYKTMNNIHTNNKDTLDKTELGTINWDLFLNV